MSSKQHSEVSTESKVCVGDEFNRPDFPLQHEYNLSQRRPIVQPVYDNGPMKFFGDRNQQEIAAEDVLRASSFTGGRYFGARRANHFDIERAQDEATKLFGQVEIYFGLTKKAK